MTVILIPREGDDLQINWWNWRPTLELLRAHAILDDVKIEMMGWHGSGVQVSEDEALRIASFLDSYLKQLGPDDRVRLDLSITDEAYPTEIVPDDPNFWKHYGAKTSLLEQLHQFCPRVAGLQSRLAPSF